MTLMDEELRGLLNSLFETLLWEKEDLKVKGYPVFLNKEKEVDVTAKKEESKITKKLHLLKKLREKIGDCKRCPLSKNRTNIVFGDGNPLSSVIFVGESPGEEEDIQGIPFCGAAGKYLDRILNAIDIKRQSIYICNVVKCRPPQNRTPQVDEIKECLPFLEEQIKIIKPSFIVALGIVASNSLLKVSEKIQNLRGKFFDYEGAKLLVTYHPSAILRNFNLRRPVWEDMKMFMEEYTKFRKGE